MTTVKHSAVCVDGKWEVAYGGYLIATTPYAGYEDEEHAALEAERLNALRESHLRTYLTTPMVFGPRTKPVPRRTYCHGEGAE